MRQSNFIQILTFILLSFAVCCYSQNTYANINSNPQVKTFINEMVREEGFSRFYLQWIFMNTNFQPAVIAKVENPQEALNWEKYKKLFVTQERVDKGMAYWKKHKNSITAASKKFGIPAPILVAFVGVESNYGEKKGKFKAISALSTLAFDHSRRPAFYRKELKHFLLLCREAKLNPLEITGSYSGALGQPQFMPSSYRAYAYDVSGKNRPNLFDNADDIIFSIGNYLVKNGWSAGAPIATRAKVHGKQFETYALTNTRKIVTPKISLHHWQQLGVTPSENYSSHLLANLIELPGGTTPELWLGFHNFYVITRYNNSQLYAMSVYQLSQLMEKKHKGIFNFF